MKRLALLMLMAHSTTAADILLGWDTSGNQQPDYYEMYWGNASGEYQWSSITYETTMLMEGLDMTQVYYFAVKACYAQAPFCSGYSNELPVVWLDERPMGCG